MYYDFACMYFISLYNFIIIIIICLLILSFKYNYHLDHLYNHFSICILLFIIIQFKCQNMILLLFINYIHNLY